MSLSSGNSGAVLREAVIKTGKGCQFEASFCRHLGEDVCPKIYSSWSGGYVMEKLHRHLRTPTLLREIETLLEERVWNRPFQNFDVEDNWIEFQKSMGIVTPEWAKPTEFCLIHGDPTVSNTMRRRDSSLVLIDPKAPNGHMPSCRETDMGKILQSYFRWETAAYGEEPIDYHLPRFMEHEETRKKAVFWAGYHAARIEQLEIERKLFRPDVLTWCRGVREACNV